MVPRTMFAVSLLALTGCGSTGRPAEEGRVENTAVAAPQPDRGAPEVPDDAVSAAGTEDRTGGVSPRETAAPERVATTPASCESEIGREAADSLARQCRAVSPATRPPCDGRNSCALIHDEIARGCGMLDEAAATEAGCTPAGGVEAAADVIRRYYSAVSARDYATAYALWNDGGKASGQSFDAFARGFRETRTARATLGAPGRIEGAAGSRYVRLPVTVDATLRDGTRQRFTGRYTLRRAAPVPGATAEDRRWHIEDASLRKG